MQSSLWRMGWRNLNRNKRRTWITVAALAGGIVFTSAGWVMTEGMMNTMVDSVSGGGTGHVSIQPPGQLVEPNLYDTLPNTAEIISVLEAREDIETAAPRIDAAGLLSTGSRTSGVMLIGVDPERQFRVLQPPPRVTAGQFVSGPGEVSLGIDLAAQLEVEPGDEVFIVTQAANGSMGSANWTVSGLVDTGLQAKNRTMAWITLEEAQYLLALDGAHSISVRLVDPSQSREIARTLSDQEGWTGVSTDLPPPEEVDPEPEPDPDAHRTPLDAEAPIVVRSWTSINRMIAQYQEMSGAWMFIMVGIILATAAMGAMNTMLMSVLERTRELGVLLAIGMKPRQIVGVIVAESLSLALLAVFIGLALGGLVSWYLVEVGLDLSADYSDMDFGGIQMAMKFDGEWIAIAFWAPALLLFVVTFLASLLPAIRAARLKPVDALGRT